NPALSTISIVVGSTRSGFTSSSNFPKRGSGTEIVPTLGSIVQNGKLADCAFALDKQLNNVDLPTFGKPTIPHFKAMLDIDNMLLNHFLSLIEAHKFSKKKSIFMYRIERA